MLSVSSSSGSKAARLQHRWMVLSADPSTGAVLATRPICEYPNVAHYIGHGATTQSSSFACRRSPAATNY
jgi:hypothetical protein